MERLSDSISVAARFSRSANLERDLLRTEPLDGYVVTARALDMVERIATAAVNTSAGGAWSVTGPYGSGKSSLALLLDAVFGASDDRRALAMALVDEVSPSVGDLVRQVHERDGAAGGFSLGLVTAQRESVGRTVLRAIRSAVERRYDGMPSAGTFPAVATLKTAIADADSTDPRRTGPSPAALVEIARCLAAEAPLLLIIDEFGKNLEAIGDSKDADPYLLQQLAEAGQGSGLPIFVVTLQHLSFEDYLADAGASQRQEWAKVQGRFDDVAYVESAAQTRALIGTVFKVHGTKLVRRIGPWSTSHAKAMRRAGIHELTQPDVIAACYPLHPLTAAVLPELCSRYGQNERTLFSFLTGPEPTTAASYLKTHSDAGRGALPSLGLDALYDYFVAGGVAASPGAAQSARWSEIATRLRDTHGLSDKQSRIAKAIAVLNLISTSGTIRASRAVLALVEEHPDGALSELETLGLITYRDFADEYRIWQGTDIDLKQLIERERERTRQAPLVSVLRAIDDPAPEVAARHSAEHDVLRVFNRRYVDGSEPIEPLDPFSPYDGEVLLVVSSSNTSLPTLSAPAAKPVLAAMPADLGPLDKSTREVAALSNLLTDDTVQGDWVARRELGERLAQARNELEHSLSATFRSDDCEWTFIGPGKSRTIATGRGSAPLSVAADIAYTATPHVRNEMLNRTDVTSQGSKARRQLLEGMIERSAEVDLGFEGYGPEVAMYRAFVAKTGLHGYDSRNEAMTFRKPTDPSLEVAWNALADEFRRAKSRRVNLNDVYATLLSPPIGMKHAVVPVFVTTGLLAASDEIALYEHGTFKPVLTPELSERMVRNPGHFDIKHFANTSGARRQVVDALAKELNVRPTFRKHRVANVLSIVGHLVSEFRHLDNFTRHTGSLSDSARSLRDALGTAIEPDELLFVHLPKSLGFSAIGPETRTYRKAADYAAAVRGALEELQNRYSLLLDELLAEVLELSLERTRLAVTGQAAGLEGEVLDPSVRSFVLTLANDTAESDEGWINSVATVVSKKAPAEWKDEDRQRFRVLVSQQIAAFHRLVALHAERRASGEPFDALRVAMTRADGDEAVLIAAITPEERPQAQTIFDEVLARLTVVTGTEGRAQQTLLALLGERLLPIHQRAPEDGAQDSPETAHG